MPTLLLPAHAPWSKTGELIDYLRAVQAQRAFAVHDGLLNDLGLGLVARAAGRARAGPADAVPPPGARGVHRALIAARAVRTRTPGSVPAIPVAGLTASSGHPGPRPPWRRSHRHTSQDGGEDDGEHRLRAPHLGSAPRPSARRVRPAGAAGRRRAAGAPAPSSSCCPRAVRCTPARYGLPEPWETRRSMPLTHSLSLRVAATGAPLVVRDARVDPELRSRPPVQELAVVAYAAMPLTDVHGRTIGVLSVSDEHPRDWTTTELTACTPWPPRPAGGCSSRRWSWPSGRRWPPVSGPTRPPARPPSPPPPHWWRPRPPPTGPGWWPGSARSCCPRRPCSTCCGPPTGTSAPRSAPASCCWGWPTPAPRSSASGH